MDINVQKITPGSGAGVASFNGREGDILPANGDYSHNGTNALQGGQSNEYYHFTTAQHSGLIEVNQNFDAYPNINGVASVQSDGSIRFGNQVAGHYTEIQPLGHTRYYGSGIVYVDCYTNGLELDGGGASAPDVVALTNGLRFRAFDGNVTTEQLFGCFEMNHDWEENSEIEFHVHFMPSTTATGKVRFELDFSICKVDDTLNDTTYDVSLADFYTITTNSIYKHKYLTIGRYTPTAKTIGSQIPFRLRRVPTHGDDTYPDDVLLYKVAMHVRSNSLGSKQSSSKD